MSQVLIPGIGIVDTDYSLDALIPGAGVVRGTKPLEIKKALCTAAYWTANSASMIANEGVDGYYETLADWKAGWPADIGASDNSLTIYCYADPTNWPNGHPQAGDFSTNATGRDATHKVTIKAAPGHEYNHATGEGFWIDFTNNWTELQLETYSEVFNIGIGGSRAASGHVLESKDVTSYLEGVTVKDDSARIQNSTFVNCTFLANALVASWRYAILTNCVFGAGASIEATDANTDDVTIKNCAKFDGPLTSDVNIVFDGASTNNADTVGTGIGSNPSIATTKDAVDFAGGDYRTALGSLLTVSGEDDGFIGTAVAPRFENHSRMFKYTVPTLTGTTHDKMAVRLSEYDFPVGSLNGYTHGSYALQVTDTPALQYGDLSPTGTFTLEWVLAGDMPAPGTEQKVFSNSGINHYLTLKTDGRWAKAREITNVRVNDVPADGFLDNGNDENSVTSSALSNAVAGDVITADYSAVSSIWVLGKATEKPFVGLLLKSMALTDNAGRHVFDFDRTTGTSILSDTGLRTLTLNNFPTDDSQWIPGWSFRNGGSELRAASDPNGYNEIPTEVVRLVTGDTPDVEVWVTPDTLTSGDEIYIFGAADGYVRPGDSEANGRYAVNDYQTSVHRLLEDSGTVADDAAGYADGTYTGNVELNAGGWGQRMYRDADAVQLWHATNYVGDSGFTLQATVAHGAGGTEGGQVIAADGSPRFWQWRSNSSGSVSAIIFYQGNNYFSFATAGGLVNDWTRHDIALVYDPAMGYYIYVDGVQRAFLADTRPIDIATGQETFIGARNVSNASEAFNGVLGHARSAKGKIKSAARIKDEYDNQFAEYLSSSSWGTVGDWEAPTFPGLARYVGYLPKESHPDFIDSREKPSDFEVDGSHPLLASGGDLVVSNGHTLQPYRYPVTSQFSGSTYDIPKGGWFHGWKGTSNTGFKMYTASELTPPRNITVYGVVQRIDPGWETGSQSDKVLGGFLTGETGSNSFGGDAHSKLGVFYEWFGDKAAVFVVRLDDNTTLAVQSPTIGETTDPFFVAGTFIEGVGIGVFTRNLATMATTYNTVASVKSLKRVDQPFTYLANRPNRNDTWYKAITNVYAAMVGWAPIGVGESELLVISEAPYHLLKPVNPTPYYYWDVAANDGIGPGETLTLEATSVAAPVATPAATIVEGLVLDASTVSVPVDAIDATLDEGAEALSLEPGTVSVPLDAPSATIVEGLVLDANTVGVPVGTPDAEITEGLVLSAGSVGVPVTAPAATLSEGLVLSASTVSVPVQAENATLVEGLQLVADTVDVPVTTPDAQIGEGLVLSTSAVSVPVSTPAAVLSEGLVLNASQIAIPLEATEASLTEGLVLQASGLAVPVDAPDASIDIGGLNLLPNAAAVPVSTPGATLVEGLVLSAGVAAVPVQAPQALYTEGLVLSAGIVPVGVGAPNAVLVEGLVFLAGAAEVPIQTYNPTLFIDNTLRLGADAIEIPTGAPAATLTEGLVLLANALAVPTSVENATLVEGLKLIANALGIDLTAEDAVVSFDPPIVYITTVDATFTVRVSETSNPIVKRIGVEVFTVRANGEVTLSQTDTARATISFDDTTVH